MVYLDQNGRFLKKKKKKKNILSKLLSNFQKVLEYGKKF